MLLKAFSVYDSKAQAYLPPFFTTQPALAMRSFEDAANKEGHDFQKYAADYTLFEIGVFDDATGIITASKAHSNLGTALSFLQQPQAWEASPRAIELARKETA